MAKKTPKAICKDGSAFCKRPDTPPIRPVASLALTWLVKKADGSVDIVNMGAAGTPLTTADKALLTVDVWEHAYYIDYRNMRPKFVETFLDKLVNWSFAEANFA